MFFTLRFTQPQLDYINALLIVQPFKDVAEIISSVNVQLDQERQEKTPAAT